MGRSQEIDRRINVAERKVKRNRCRNSRLPSARSKGTPRVMDSIKSPIDQILWPS